MRKWIVSAIVTIAIIFLIGLQIPREGIEEMFSDVLWQWILVAALIYAASTVIRAWRFRLLGLSCFGLEEMTVISFIYYLWTNILPFRSGELSFFYLIRKSQKSHLARAATALVIARVFDFLAIIIWLIISLMAVFPARLSGKDPVFVGAILLLFLLLGLLVTLLAGRRLIRRTIILPLANLLGRRWPNTAKKIEIFWTEFDLAAAEVNSRRTLFAAAGSSLFAWGLLFFMTWLFMLGLGQPLPFWQSVFITALPPIASLIPIGTIGNFGTVEAGWALGLTLIAFQGPVLVTSVALHVLTLVLSAAGAATAYLYYKLALKN